MVRITGIVVYGNQLGRTVGMPTANFEYQDVKLEGVYVSKVILPDGSVRPGLTNIGTKPSVDDTGKKNIETYIIDFSGDLYGRRLTIEIFDKIRDIKKFANLAEVKAQVDKDLEAAESKFLKFYGAAQDK